MKTLTITLLFFTMLTKAQTNDHFSHTETTSAPPEAIWKIWTDVSNWKQWDKGLKDAELANEFKIGAKGKLVPDKGPVARFIIVNVIKGQAYTFKTRIPFGWLVITRRLSRDSSVTTFTHEVQFTGLFRKPLGNKLGARYRLMLPEVMAEIKRIAELK